MRKVYVCDAPFNKKEIDNLSDEQMDDLKEEIENHLIGQLMKGRPKWTPYEWLVYFMKKAFPFEMVQAWNEFNKGE
jgi:hypothetical protein